MDLRTEYPRSAHEPLNGYVHLARMIDKSRAVLAQTQGEYIFPCPMDQLLLEFVALTPEQFLEAVSKGSDTEVANWVCEEGASHSQEEIGEWNRRLLAREPDTEEKWDYFKEVRDAIDPSRADIRSWADLLDLEEGREVPIRLA